MPARPSMPAATRRPQRLAPRQALLPKSSSGAPQQTANSLTAPASDLSVYGAQHLAWAIPRFAYHCPPGATSQTIHETPGTMASLAPYWRWWGHRAVSAASRFRPHSLWTGGVRDARSGYVTEDRPSVSRSTPAERRERCAAACVPATSANLRRACHVCRPIPVPHGYPPMAAIPPMYGRSTSGTTTVPSACWLFSRMAMTMRGSARPEPLSVCTNSGFSPSAGR